MNIFTFGEKIVGYEVPVINERVARAGAGILFAIGLVTFMKSFLTHDFSFAKVFITFFMIDFFIRVFVNDKLSPSLILGYFFTRKQAPEYVGASQKRFAWGIGFVLASAMFIIVVVLEMMTPIKLAICFACLTFLFFESAFGICLGCKIYHLFKKDTLYCAGGCEVSNLKQVSLVQWVILTLTIVLVSFGFVFFSSDEQNIWQQKITDMPTDTNSSHCGGMRNEDNMSSDIHMNHGM